MQWTKCCCSFWQRCAKVAAFCLFIIDISEMKKCTSACVYVYVFIIELIEWLLMLSPKMMCDISGCCAVCPHTPTSKTTHTSKNIHEHTRNNIICYLCSGETTKRHTQRISQRNTHVPFLFTYHSDHWHCASTLSILDMIYRHHAIICNSML